MAISDADKLAAYNGALVEILGSRPLASLTEEREPRRILDQIWASGGIVRYALERGDWNFATRTIELSVDSSITPSFGYDAVFTKPTDVARVTTISRSPDSVALKASEYVDEAQRWYANGTTLYIKYVSDDPDYGFESSRWTESFTDYLKALMAFRGGRRIASPQAMRDAKQLMELALKAARSDDAMAEGVKMLPSGSWRRSRGNSGSRYGGE